MAEESVIPNTELIRDLLTRANWSRETLAAEGGLAVRTVSRLFANRRVQRATVARIADALGANVADLILGDDSTERLCDRISHADLWEDFEDALRQIVVSAGASAMRTYAEAARDGTKPARSAFFQSVLSEDVARANPSLESDLDATLTGIRTAELLLRPLGDRLDCAVSYLAEESARFGGSLDSLILRFSDRVKPPATFFRRQSNLLRLLLDPLDGTANYAREVPIFVSAATLLVDDQPRVAAAFDPIRMVCYSASLAGPYDYSEKRVSALEWEMTTGRIRDAVDRSRTRPGAAGVAVHFPRGDESTRRQMVSCIDGLAEKFGTIYALNAGIPAMIAVSRGSIAAFVNPSTERWDAAGEVFVRACGGVVTDWEGRPIRYDDAARTSLVAARVEAHGPVLATLASADIRGASAAQK